VTKRTIYREIAALIEGGLRAFASVRRLRREARSAGWCAPGDPSAEVLLIRTGASDDARQK
jgi:hypothetical protein